MSRQVFVGHKEEQTRFRDLLWELTNRSKRDQGRPTVILIFGQAGIGKTDLAKQFRNIANDEFADKFQTFFLAWEEELERDPRLQVGHDDLEAEAVFDALYKAIIREQPAWGKHFTEYEDFLKRYDQVHDAIIDTVNQREELRELVGLGAKNLAKLIARSVPIPQPYSEPFEAMTSMGLELVIPGLAEGLAKLRERLRKKFDNKQYDLLLRPNEQISRAVGQGLAWIAKERRFILFLDTYELVDKVDFWLRDAIKAAGPRLIWVLSGRRNLLKSDFWGTKLFKGYDKTDGTDFHVIGYDMQALGAEDIKEYFATALPKRPLTPDQFETIERGTLGIPLAVRTAANVYEETGKLEGAVSSGRGAPGKDIVQVMMSHLLYTVGQTGDVRQRQKEEASLCAISLADGYETLLQAMLPPEDSQDLILHEYLSPLKRKYASIFQDNLKLHEAAGSFLREHFRMKREEKWVQRINERAIAFLQTNLEKQAQLGRASLEARCNNEDWVKIALKLTDHLFWLDEMKGWRWLMPRFIESLVYNSNLRDSMLHAIGEWQPVLSSVGKKRLDLMRSAKRFSFPLLSRYISHFKEEEDLLNDLEPLVEQLKWLEGNDEGEYWAIWHTLRGELAFRKAVYQHKSCIESAEILSQVLPRLPKDGRKLRERLAQDFNVLGNYSPVPAEAAIYFEKAVQCDSEHIPALLGLGLQYSYLGMSDKATQAYQQAINLIREVEIAPENASARQNLAAAYNNLAYQHYDSEQYEQALALFEKARGLNPEDDVIHASIGDTQANLNHVDEAVEAYKVAIELDPGHVRCYLALAVMYRLQGFEQQLEEQLELARQAATPKWLSNEWDPFNRACFAAVVDNDMEKVLQLLDQSFNIYPGLRSRARHEPAFHFIQADSRFRELVNG